MTAPRCQYIRLNYTREKLLARKAGGSYKINGGFADACPGRAFRNGSP